MICSQCLTVAEPRQIKERPGSGPATGMILFGIAGFFFPLLFLVAGLFFLAAVARAITHAASGKVTLECSTCKAAVVPLDSPGGKLLVSRLPPPGS